MFSGDNRITISGGVAQFEPSMTHPHELVEAADEALYVAKALGPNRILRSDAASAQA